MSARGKDPRGGLKVASIIDGFAGFGGGVTTYLETVIPALGERGIDNIVLAGQPADGPVTIPYRVVPDIDDDVPRLSAAARAGLEEALRETHPDVCFVHVISPDVVAVAARFAPTFFFAHEYLTVCPGGTRYLQHRETFCTDGPGLRCFVRAYSERTTNRRPDRLLAAYRRVRDWRETWQLLDGILVASEFVGDALARDGAPADLIRVLPYPIRARDTASTASAPTFDVLYLGRLTNEKGVHVLLNALAKLDGASAVIAGEGPARSRLEALTTDLGLADRVRFAGWVSPEEAARLLTQSRVLAVPSLWAEAFGIVGVEALASRVPVVASSVGGIPSWLDDEVTGLLVPPGDVAALASALERVLSDSELRTRLAERGPAAARRFSVEAHVNALLAVFEGAR